MVFKLIGKNLRSSPVCERRNKELGGNNRRNCSLFTPFVVKIRGYEEGWEFRFREWIMSILNKERSQFPRENLIQFGSVWLLKWISNICARPTRRNSNFETGYERQNQWPS